MNLNCGVLHATPEEYVILMHHNKSCLLINIKHPERDEWLLGVGEDKALLWFEADFVQTLNTIHITITHYQSLSIKEQDGWFSYLEWLKPSILNIGEKELPEVKP